MRILYVEDNEVNRALVERVMRARQCSVVFEDEGEGALDTLAKDPVIDLILLDIELAGSMTGLDVIHAMRARNDHRPVVAVTAYAMMGDRERFLEAGCDQYLPKPLVVTDLLNMIDHYQAEITKAAAKTAEAAPIEPAAEARAAAQAIEPTTVVVNSNGHRADVVKAEAAPAPAASETPVSPQMPAAPVETPSAPPAIQVSASAAAPSAPAPQAEQKPPEEDPRTP